MNKLFLIGRVGQNPTIKVFQNGGKIAQFALATTERGYKTKDGKEVPEVTDWHNIVVKAAGLAKVCESYVKKGSQLSIVGKVRTRKYQDAEGNDKSITEVIVEEMELLGSKKAEGSPAAENRQPADNYQPITSDNNGADDLPW